MSSSSGARRAAIARAIAGFYAVLDREDEALAGVLATHAHVLQVRLKPRDRRVDTVDLVRVARMARRVCDAARIALVVNDRVDVALAVGADGVHLGQTDLPLAAARAIAGDRLWIGVSTHDLAQVEAACHAGADYLGFGPVFATPTKTNPDPVQGTAMLARVVELAARHDRRVVAIGGITPATAAAVRASGAAAICAIGAVNEAGEPGVAAAAIRSVFHPG